jgi:biopolymer transport protein TolR
VRAEINVTPLIDIMLVLLILFMLVTPTANRTIDTQVPRPPDAESPSPVHPLVITVEPDEFRLGETPVPTAKDLGLRLQEVLSNRHDRTVFVRAEGEVTYGRVVEALDEARGAGAARIGMLGASRPGGE